MESVRRGGRVTKHGSWPTWSRTHEPHACAHCHLPHVKDSFCLRRVRWQGRRGSQSLSLGASPGVLMARSYFMRASGVQSTRKHRYDRAVPR